MVSVSARACSWISLCMKCLWPFFSAMVGVQSMRRTLRASLLPERSVSSTPFLVITSKSPSSRKITSRVCARIAGTSLATKLHLSPSPSTSGEAFFATTSISGDRSLITASAYVPFTFASAARTASGSAFPDFSSSAIRCAKISVSVSEANLCPAWESVSFSSRWFSMIPLCTTATPPYLCGCAFSSDGLPCVAQHRHARRVIAAVLELAQPVHQEARALLVAHVSHDPAHALPPPLQPSSSRPTPQPPDRSLLALLLHPPLDVALLPRAHRKGPRRNVFAHGRAGAHVRALVHGHGGDELGVRPDERAVLDDRHVLLLAVVVASDRARADVHALADHRVAQVGEVVRFAALSQHRLLQLHEVADVRLFGNLRTGPQTCKGPHDRPLAEPGAVQMAVREDARAVLDLHVDQHAPLAHLDALAHQRGQPPLAQARRAPGELGAIVDAAHLLLAGLDGGGPRRPSLARRSRGRRDDVRQVVFPLHVVAVRLAQRLEQERRIGQVDPRVHLADLLLGGGSVLLLDDALGKALLVAHDAPVPLRVGRAGGDEGERSARVLLRPDQPLQSLGRDERGVAAQEQDASPIGEPGLLP